MSGYDTDANKEQPERYGFGTRGIGRWVAVAGGVILVLFCLMLGNCSTGRQDAPAPETHENAHQQRNPGDKETRHRSPSAHESGEIA